MFLFILRASANGSWPRRSRVQGTSRGHRILVSRKSWIRDAGAGLGLGTRPQHFRNQNAATMNTWMDPLQLGNLALSEQSVERCVRGVRPKQGAI
jgi:hypothetical protein